MKQRKLTLSGVAGVAMLIITLMPTWTQAAPLDQRGEMTLGLRAYVNARIGTEHTDESIGFSKEQLTWPLSDPGHLRQNRFFVEAEYHHDLRRLQKEGFGPLELLNHLPFRVKGLAYHLTFRGEYDGIYDYGPSEYRTSDQYFLANSKAESIAKLGKNPDREKVFLPNPIGGPRNPDGSCAIQGPHNANCFRIVDQTNERRRLRENGIHRERLFQAYVQATVGRLFMRLGRQVWSWGETDGFRLLDQINPIDSSFGGFLIPLDERRVPLDMVRAEYRVGRLGPFSEVAIHGYAAFDDAVGFTPATGKGSPWTLINDGKPSVTTVTSRQEPARNFTDARGGGRIVFNLFDATFSLAHYYTYMDRPFIQSFVEPGDPNATNPQDRQGFPLKTFPDGANAHGILRSQRTQISGATTTFAIPQLYAIVRSELAYFKDEARYEQEQLDPFVYRFQPGACSDPTKPCSGGTSKGDSWNFVLGLDVNQYIRFLNPNQTFFFSTQFFYKHLRAAAPHPHTRHLGTFNTSPGQVLPIAEWDVDAFNFGRVEPIYVREPTDQFLQTFFVNTSFMSGQVQPSFTFFYDWGGAFVYLPSIKLVRDPWRFSVSYVALDAGRLKGGSGVSLLKDRDNIEFRFEYAI